MSSELEKQQTAQKLSTLRFQNGKLSAQLQVQRNQISDLESKLEQQDAKRDAYADTLLTVNSLWNQLNTDIRFLSSRCVQACGKDEAQPDSCAAAQPSENCVAGVANDTKVTLQATVKDLQDKKHKSGDAADPFLYALLRGEELGVKEVLGRQEDINGYATEVEQQLRKRAAATSASLAALLRQIDAAWLAARTAALSGAPQDAQQQLRDLQQECVRLSAATDAGAALRRALNAQLQQANAHSLLQDTKIKELENELADCLDELRAVQRKLVVARNASADVKPAAAAAGSGGPSKATTAVKLEPTGNGQVAAAEAAFDAEETSRLLVKRGEEVDAERLEVARLQRELHGMQAAEPSEAAVRQSPLYKDLERRVSELRTELDRRAAILEGLNHQLESLRRREHDLMIQAEQAQHGQAQTAYLSAQLAELGAALSVCRTERDTARTAVIQASHTAPANTAAELQATLTALQRQNRGLEASLARHRATSAATEVLRKSASTTRAALAEQKELLRLAKSDAADQRSVAEQLRGQCTEAEARCQDLHVIVDALRTVEALPSAAPCSNKHEGQAPTATGGEPSPAAPATRTALAAAQAATQAAADAASRESGLIAERDKYVGQMAACQSRLSDLQGQLSSAKEEGDAYIAEIGSIGAAYEELQGQNGRLLSQLASNDRVNGDLVAERVKAVVAAQEASESSIQATRKAQDASSSAAALQEQMAATQLHLQGLVEEAAAARAAARAATLQAEVLSRDLKERDTALALKTAVCSEAVEGARAAKRALEGEAEKTVRERTKRQRLEEDHQGLQNRLERLRKFENSGAADGALREEVAAQKKLLRCGVCNSKQKDCIITKCWHIFCSACIKANLDTRHRKCPACGAAFGQADVRQIYLG